jgi:hypothetical protein
MTEAGDPEVARVAHVADQAGHVHPVGVQLKVVDPVVRTVDDDDAPPQRVERVTEQLPGPAVAGDQQERLAQPGHPSPEPLQGHRLPERAVLQQREQ